jgi:hypothetical protein
MRASMALTPHRHILKGSKTEGLVAPSGRLALGQRLIKFAQSELKRGRVEGMCRFCVEKGLEGGEATGVRLDGHPPETRRKWQRGA